MPTEPNTPATPLTPGALVIVTKKADSLFGHVFKVLEEGFDWIKAEIKTEVGVVEKFFHKDHVAPVGSQATGNITAPSSAQVAKSEAANAIAPGTAPTPEPVAVPAAPPAETAPISEPVANVAPAQS